MLNSKFVQTGILMTALGWSGLLMFPLRRRIRTRESSFKTCLDFIRRYLMTRDRITLLHDRNIIRFSFYFVLGK